MKLRLEGNSIRLRVRKSDLNSLQKDGAIIETLTFPNQLVFNYQLRTDNNISEVTAQFSNAGILVGLPFSQTQLWIQSDEVGIEATLSSGLFILIEKDFPCKDRPLEDTADTFFELADHESLKC